MISEFMEYWLPCWYAALWILGSITIALVAGYYLGRMREQLSLLELLRPNL